MTLPLLAPGTRFNRLVVIDDRGKVGRYHMVLCRCDCGSEKLINRQHLVRSLTKSCGCFRRDFSTQKGANSFTHGESRNGKRTAEYMAWDSMWSRCSNLSSRKYKYYGSRGIVVCDRWRSFENFLDDMGRKPTPRHSLDRIDVNGNYELSNCRWATDREQAINRRITRWLTINGKTLCFSDWCARIGISHDALQYRISNWPQSRWLDPPRGYPAPRSLQ